MSHARPHFGARPRARRGIALLDVLIGGILLAVGLAVLLTLSGRALAMQTGGEKRMTASWLADELMNMVVVAGPDLYGRQFDTSGSFDAPFEDFDFEVDIDDQGIGAPFRVNAVVWWSDRERDRVRVETLIAPRLGEPEQLREPFERVDRDARYFDDEMEGG